MKQRWLLFAAKIDALGLRERILVFLGAALVLLELVNATLLSQQLSKETELSRQIAQDQSQIAGLQAEIRATIDSYNHNPDAAKQLELKQAKAQLTEIRASLQDMQKGLVSPDRMAGLLEDILKQNGKLHLVSLRTLPPSDLVNPEQGDTKATDKTVEKNTNGAGDKAEKKEQANLVYKHGVEIVLEGEYFDMVNYMAALESSPWQLYWGKAKLSADESAKLSLTLTLYTLSLDKKWLNI